MILHNYIYRHMIEWQDYRTKYILSRNCALNPNVLGHMIINDFVQMCLFAGNRRRLILAGGTGAELLNGEIFYSLREAQIIIESWRKHYNTKRPHSALGYRPPDPEAIILMDQRPIMH